MIEEKYGPDWEQRAEAAEADRDRLSSELDEARGERDRLAKSLDDAVDHLADEGNARGDVEGQLTAARRSIEGLRERMIAAEGDLLNIRGVLSPNGGVRLLPPDMQIGDELAPAVEWLVRQLDEARAEIALANEAGKMGTAISLALQERAEAVEAQRDQASRSYERERDRADALRNEAQAIAARLGRELDEARAELDEARAVHPFDDAERCALAAMSSEWAGLEEGLAARGVLFATPFDVEIPNAGDAALLEIDRLRQDVLALDAGIGDLTQERDEARAAYEKLKGDRILSVVFGHHKGAPRPFGLRRREDVSGVSGTGMVALGSEFPDGAVVLRWTSAWPTSVVFHDRGIESVEAIHGHDGRTEIVWLSDELPSLAEMEQRAEAAEADRDRLLVVYRAAEAWAEVGRTRTSQTGNSSIWLHEYGNRRDALIAAVDSYRSAAPAEPAPGGGE